MAVISKKMCTATTLAILLLLVNIQALPNCTFGYRAEAEPTHLASITGTGMHNVGKMIVDSQGNMIILGNAFNSVVSFSRSNNATFFTGANIYIVFVAKYANNGSLLWQLHFPEYVYFSQVFADSNNNVLLQGTFSGSAGAITFYNTVLPMQPSSRALILKLNGTDGSFLWLTSFSNEMSYASVMDMSDNSFLLATSSVPATTNITVRRILANGQTAFETKFMGTDNYLSPTYLLLTKSNLIILAGYSGASYVYGLDLYRKHASSDAFIACIDAQGQLKWVKSFGSTDTTIYFSDMVSDSKSNLYVSFTVNGIVASGYQYANVTFTANSVVLVKIDSVTGTLIQSNPLFNGAQYVGKLANKGQDEIAMITSLASGAYTYMGKSVQCTTACHGIITFQNNTIDSIVDFTRMYAASVEFAIAANTGSHFLVGTHSNQASLSVDGVKYVASNGGGDVFGIPFPLPSSVTDDMLISGDRHEGCYRQFFAPFNNSLYLIVSSTSSIIERYAITSPYTESQLYIFKFNYNCIK